MIRHPFIPIIAPTAYDEAMTRFRRAQIKLARLDEIFPDPTSTDPVVRNARAAAARELESARAVVEELED